MKNVKKNKQTIKKRSPPPAIILAIVLTVLYQYEPYDEHTVTHLATLYICRDSHV